MKEHGLFLFINDHIEMIGDRFYVKATATITTGKTNKKPLLTQRRG
ncbi:hypothetical protein V039C_0001 [Vibrio phage V039C]|nr:hypothetical protein V039C_0001 [Vibrio phage V039C]